MFANGVRVENVNSTDTKVNKLICLVVAYQQGANNYTKFVYNLSTNTHNKRNGDMWALSKHRRIMHIQNVHHMAKFYYFRRYDGCLVCRLANIFELLGCRVVFELVNYQPHIYKQFVRMQSRNFTISKINYQKWFCLPFKMLTSPKYN